MAKWRVVEFVKTAGYIGGGSVTLAIVLFGVTIYEHIQDHNVASVILCALGVAFFCVGCYTAWGRERDKRIEGEKKWDDQRPCLGLEINSFEGEKTWREHPTPVTIVIKHLGGRVPTSIHFEEIQSKSGKFMLRFDSLPHIDPPHPKPMMFEVIEIGQPELSARDREITHAYQRDMLLLFLADTPKCSGEVDYPLVARYSDRSEPHSQTFNLRWSWNRHGFLRDTT